MRYYVAFFVLLMVKLVLPGTDIEKVIKNVQKKYKEYNTFQIDFKQSNRFKLTGIESEMYGTLLLSQNEKFRLETEDQTVVSDGTTYWRFNKLENQVVIDHAQKSQQDAFFGNFIFNISDKYFSQIISEYKEEDKKILEIKLTPKNTEESFFTYIKVWIIDKSWELQKVVYVDFNNNESEYVIEKITYNPKIEDRAFLFSTPEGADEIDLRF